MYLLPLLGVFLGPYVAAGVGASPDLGGDFDGVLSGDGHSSGRVGIGHSLGPASLEAGIAGFGVTATAPTGESANGTAISAQLAARLQLPVAFGLDAFGRGGIDRTWIGPTPSAEDRLVGRGYVIGAGLEYGIDLPLASAGVWVEYDRQWITVPTDYMTFEGTADTLLAGLRVGI
jgi:hypothetical protein